MSPRPLWPSFGGPSPRTRWMVPARGPGFHRRVLGPVERRHPHLGALEEPLRGPASGTSTSRFSPLRLKIGEVRVGRAAAAACRAATAEADGDDLGLSACAARRGAKISCETVLAVTALTPAQASPAFLLARNRDHWGIKTACTTAATPPSPKTPANCEPASPGGCSPQSPIPPSACSTAPATPTTPRPAATSAGTAPDSRHWPSSACNQPPGNETGSQHATCKPKHLL